MHYFLAKETQKKKGEQLIPGVAGNQEPGGCPVSCWQKDSSCIVAHLQMHYFLAKETQKKKKKKKGEELNPGVAGNQEPGMCPVSCWPQGF